MKLGRRSFLVGAAALMVSRPALPEHPAPLKLTGAALVEDIKSIVQEFQDGRLIIYPANAPNVSISMSGETRSAILMHKEMAWAIEELESDQS